MSSEKLSASAWYFKSFEEFNEGNPDQALISINKSIELDNVESDSWYHLARILSHLEKKHEMITALKKAIDLSYDNKVECTEDEDFSKYWNDEDFLEMITPGWKTAPILEKAIESGNVEEMSKALEKLGTEISPHVIQWDDCYDVGIDIESLFDYADELSLDALINYFNTLVYNLKISRFIYDSMYAYGVTVDQLKKRLEEHEYNTILLDAWYKRYDELEARRFDIVDVSILSDIEDISTDILADFVYDEISTYGADKFKYFKTAAAKALNGIAEDGELYHKLILKIDSIMNGDQYKNEEFTNKSKRILLSLPTPI